MAMRTPISWVRSETEYAITLATPMMTSSKPMDPKDERVTSSNFGMNTSPGVPCQGNSPRVGQAQFKLNF